MTSPLLNGRQEGEMLPSSCTGRSSGLWGWSWDRSGSSRVTPVCCHRGWRDMSCGWLSPLAMGTPQGLPGDAPGCLGNTLLCARNAQAGPSSPWLSLGHSRASLRGKGGWLWAEQGKGMQSCSSITRSPLLWDTTRSQQDWGLLGHQHPSAPPNPHWGSCSPSWEVSSHGLVPLVVLEVQKWSSLGSAVWRLQGRAVWH